MIQVWNRTAKLEKLAPLVVFLGALLPRLLSLNAFITWDEPMWVYRSVRFLSALLHGDFAGTYLVGHPGVITMISGAIGVAVRSFLLGRNVADVTWLAALPALEPTDVEAMRRLAPFLLAAKVPMAVLHAACVAAVYLLLKRLLDLRTAALAAFLVALDPFHIALSRVLHMDAAATDLMLLSLLALIVSLRYRSRPYLLFSGALAGLAVLGKSYALLLVPVTGAVLLVAGAKSRLRLRDIGLRLVVWGSSAVLAFCAFWPAMWVNLIGTVRGVLETALGYSATAEATSNFFLGRAVDDPGPWFYPVVLAFCTTPLAWLGLMALLGFAVLACLRDQRGRRDARWQDATVWILIAYAVWFGLAMAIAAKKFDRYMLPVMIALDILAAVGLVQFLRTWNRPAARWLVLAALAVQGAFSLSYHPYYLTYYNPLLGGARRARSVLPFGWGEGMDLAANYLNSKDHTEGLSVATAGIPGFAPLFPGRVEPVSERGVATTDYALVYVSDRQQGAPIAQEFVNREPEHVVQVHGVDYVWIYPNAENVETASYLRNRMSPQDAILMDAPSPLQRDYPGAYLLSGPYSEVAVQELLGSIPSAAGRLWYVSYAESDPHGWIDYQLSTQMLLLERESFGSTTVSCYAPPADGASEHIPLQADLCLDFGGQLRLLACQLSTDTVEYRQSLGVTFLWQALGQPGANYAASVRVVDSSGHVWAQEDRWVLDPGGVPTAAWQASETNAERHLLAVPPGIPPDSYDLKVSVYDTNSLQSLPLVDSAGSAVGTGATVATFQVRAPTFPPGLQDLDIPQRLSEDLGQVELLGYGLTSSEVRPGDVLQVSLFWRALGLMEQDYILSLVLRDDAGKVWSEETLPLPDESYLTSQWRPGEVFRVACDIPIAAAIPTGRYWLVVNLLEVDGKALRQDAPAIAEVQVVARKHLFAAPQPAHSIQAQIGEAAVLLGYDLDRTAVESGGHLR
ncbi:MAG: hypothetical protein FJ026_09260, partial [Chloroflexi bacterium]|nr:hypothetical protein [Chloroflexota bacterium]